MVRSPNGWFLAASMMTLFACSGADTAPVEVAGECQDVFEAQVCTWATVNGSDVLEFGATIPMASIENAPAEVPMAWPPPTVASVRLPEAATAATGYTNMTVYWEPTGHAPATFMVPHFDFHFYTISSDDRMAIDCADETKPATLADGYAMPDEVLPEEVAAMIGVSTLVGLCVPEMGMHSLSAVEMASETPFSSTMVVGYYHGRDIFIEPMISRAALLERRSFDLTVPSVPGHVGAEPTHFRAEYMPDQNAYRFVFPTAPAS